MIHTVPHSNALTLNLLPVGQQAIVLAMSSSEDIYNRLAALGINVGRPITMLRRALGKGPVHVRVGTTEIMLRVEQARTIKVRPTNAA